MRAIVLASASPRRAALLEERVARVEIVPSPLPEPARKPRAVSAAAWAEALAYFKARSVAEVRRDAWVLGADTVVECGGVLLGKAADAGEARRMLLAQAGRASRVVTGVALVRMGSAGRLRWMAHDATWVWMRDDPAAVDAYVASGDWVGKAGAYGIQDAGDRLVERIEGSFSNVVGLPIELVARMLDVADRMCARQAPLARP